MGTSSHLLLFPAVLFIILTVGFAPGCLAILVATLGADYFFITPLYQFKFFWQPTSVIRMIVFAVTSFFTGWAIRKTQQGEKLLIDQLAAKSEGEEKFQVMADCAPVMVWIAQSDKRCTWLNKGWLDFVGRTLKEESGSGWTQGIHPEDYQRCLQAYNSNFDARREFYIEYRLKHHSGDYRWISDRGVPRYDSEGQFEGYVGACMDIQEQHDVKAELEVTASKLADAVRVRDDFLSIASHELKTPLTSLRLQAQQLSRAIEKGDVEVYSPERIKTHSERSDRQIGRLARLIDDMLDVSRISTGQLSMEKERFDLSALVHDVLDRLEPQFAHWPAGRPIVSECEDSSGNWDRLRIDQVIVNLLTNALRYGNQKEIAIQMRCTSEDVSVSVVDHGIGVSTENLKRIFNQFERAVDSTEASGLGLGLFICSKIVAAHGGQIEVESTLGEGSTFTVKLPRDYASKTLERGVDLT
jgi:PAS domain S-box-containing protein